MDRFLSLKWTNKTLRFAAIGLAVIAIYVIVFLSQASGAGRQPKQPVPYSHALHAGELKIDCRYCHHSVERSAQASIPPAQTCMNCHKSIRADSPQLTLIRDSYTKGIPVEWIRIHDLPDYVYFNHSAHVMRGVGCVSCHGRVDAMPEINPVNPLRMSWCLDCHRNPEKNLRPLDAMTQMDWKPESNQETVGLELQKKLNLNPSVDCSTCHR